MHVDYMSQGFLNLIETLLWFYLETFMWLNEFLQLIETLLWLIKLLIWWGDKRIDMIRHSKIWLRLYFGWIYSRYSKNSHF